MPGQAHAMRWMHPIKSFKNWLLGQSGKKPAIIEALITDETVKTIQVNYKSRTAWLQKSLVLLKKSEGDKVTIIIPLWLFTRKFAGLKQTNQSRGSQHSGSSDQS